jgi:hypothetical protein
MAISYHHVDFSQTDVIIGITLSYGSVVLSRNKHLPSENLNLT